MLYIIGMTALMLWQGIGIAPDRYAVVLLLGSLLVKRTRQFLLDWIPFLFILLAYDFLRGFADNVTGRVHIHELINADLALFGYLPTVELQKALHIPGQIQWFEVIGTTLYFLHFALPLGLGFILWLVNRSRFREFTLSLLLLSYAGWITYIIYPAMPPWMASNQGYIPPITKIMDQAFMIFPTHFQVPTIYHQFNPNPVAAMPSMHAAYPLLVLLFLIKNFGKKGFLFLPYVLGMWFSIVYLGEHYVIDVIVGAIYSIVFFILTHYLWKKFGPKLDSITPNLS